MPPAAGPVISFTMVHSRPFLTIVPSGVLVIAPVLASYIEKSLKEIDFDAKRDDFSALKNFAKDKPIVFLCNGPECWKSYKASRTAQTEGYAKIYWFRGGMPEWREKHLPVDGTNGAAVATKPAPTQAQGRAKTVASR